MLADAQYKVSRGAGLGLFENTAHPSSGLRVREFAASLPWAPALCTGHNPLLAASVSISHLQQTNVAATFAEPVVNSATWKEIKVTQQRLPFPCTPVVRYRETANDDTWATGTTGGAQFRVRLTGYDQFNRPVIYEMPDWYTTLANNATGFFDAADNRALDTILHVPTIFSQIIKIEYQAASVHANQDFLDVGVAFTFDGFAAVFHLSANNAATGGPSLTKWGTKQPSVRLPWVANQAIGLTLHMDGTHIITDAVRPAPAWTKNRYGIEVIHCSLKNMETLYAGGGEHAVLAPLLNVNNVKADVVEAAVLNGHTALSTTRGGFLLNYISGLTAIGNNKISPGRLSINITPTVNVTPCSTDDCPRNVVTKTSLLTLVFVGTAKTIERSSGSWIADGYAAGQSIVVSGSASNNGTLTIARVTDKIITMIAADTVVNETNTNGATIAAPILGPRNFGWSAHRTTLPTAADGDGTGASTLGHEFFLNVLYRTAKNTSNQAGSRTSSNYPT